jgi:serine/threonine protein kinase
MRYMSGGSLTERLQGKPLPLQSASRIIEQIASALDVAHARGIVHRDLKPDNILFDNNNNAFLADFGIVKVASVQATALTSSGGVIGTPAYMSPEQAMGDVPIDGRSDVYSLGIVLYQMLAGEAPYHSETPIGTAMMHVIQPVPQINSVRTDLPSQYQGLIDRALAKDPDNRFPTAGALAGAFIRLVQQKQTAQSDATFVLGAAAAIATPTPTPPAVQTPPPLSAENESTRRSRWPWLIGVVALLLICGATSFALYNTGVIDPAQFGLQTGDAEEPAAVANSATSATDTPAPTATPKPTNTVKPTATPTPTATLQPTADVQGAVEVAVAATLTASAPTNTPTQTPTKAPTKTPSPTPSPTAKATATQSASANTSGSVATGSGMPLTFEDFGTWRIGNQRNGSFTRSSKQAHAGSYSGELAYEFETADNDFVVFLQDNAISGTPNALELWVYGDGSGHFINAWILDNDGQTWQVPFGQVFHTGWSKMTGYIDTDQDWPWTSISGTDNKKVDYPIAFRAFVLDDYSSSYEGNGSIYLDDLRAVTTSGVPGTTPVASRATNTPSGENGTPQPTVDPNAIGRIIFTSGSKLMAADPALSTATEIGTVANNSCGSPATTDNGVSVNLYFGSKCVTGESIHNCVSPNGQYEVLVDGRNLTNVVTVRSVGSDAVFSVYQGSLDRSSGIRWSPLSNAFLFNINGGVHVGRPNQAGYSQIISQGQNPIFSPDGSQILYRPTAGGDIYVADASGANQLNVTNSPGTEKTCVAWRR